MRKLLTMSKILLFPLLFCSATYHVPDDFPTIQGALADPGVVSGDIIIVRPGIYVENIDFLGKAVTVKSEQGSLVTIIDGGNPTNPDHGSVVTFNNGESKDSILEGFTLVNGKGTLSSFSMHNGGGIFCQAASPTLRSNIIMKNDIIGNGGGVFCLGASAPTIEGNTIMENQIIADGGGIACFDGASPTVTGNIIAKNWANYGGGIMAYNSAHPVLIDNLITENQGGFGGGIQCLYAAGTMVKNRIIDNTAFAGGGLECESCSLVSLQDNIIAHNKAGGIICIGIDNAVIKDNQVFENLNGSGIQCEDCTVLLENNRVYKNAFRGLYLGSCKAALANDIIYGNTGGGIASASSSARIVNITCYGNQATDYGGSIFCWDSSKLEVTNSILWNNHADIGYEIAVGTKPSGPSILSISFSDMESGPGSVYVYTGNTFQMGPGMIDSEPLFVDSVESDFHLTFTSPCRESGYNAAPGIPEYDFEGDPRIAYGTVDMGADEFYTHLYYMGNATPGGNVEIKFVGLPATNPVFLWVGSDVLGAPIPTMYGDWYLDFPILLTLGLGPIVSPEGVSVLPYTFDPLFPAMEIPMQSLIGMELTNLLCMQIQ